jgi:ferredoxin
VIHVVIDGREVAVEPGATVLDAAAQLGIAIPQLCAQGGMRPYGACRVCTVEMTQEGRTRLQAACSCPATEALEVRTDAERVLCGRQIILTALLGGVEGVQADQGGIRLRAGAPELELALPIEGEVVRVNPEIEMVPRLVGFSPYERGWLPPVRPIGSAAAGLLSGPEAACWIREEVRRLETFVGCPAAEIEMPIPARQWGHVRNGFFDGRGVNGLCRIARRSETHRSGEDATSHHRRPPDDERSQAGRARPPTLPAQSHKRGFFEVESTLPTEEPIREARRCLRCDLQFTQPKEEEAAGRQR